MLPPCIHFWINQGGCLDEVQNARGDCGCRSRHCGLCEWVSNSNRLTRLEGFGHDISALSECGSRQGIGGSSDSQAERLPNRMDIEAKYPKQFQCCLLYTSDAAD